MWFKPGPRLWQLLLVEQTSMFQCSFDVIRHAVVNLQSAANVATHTYELHTQHLLLPCWWDFGASDTNWRWDEWSRDLLFRCFSINILCREQIPSTTTTTTLHAWKVTFEHEWTCTAESFRAGSGNLETFCVIPKKKKMQTASKEAGDSCEEWNLCNHHGKFCKNIHRTITANKSRTCI